MTSLRHEPIKHRRYEQNHFHEALWVLWDRAHNTIIGWYTMGAWRSRGCHPGQQESVEKTLKPLWLRRGGGRDGKDNRYIQHAAIHTLDKYLTEKGIDAMVVAPKCTKGNSWATIRKHVYSMIESLVADYNNDVSRIYLMGTSFGAQGGWALLSERPD